MIVICFLYQLMMVQWSRHNTFAMPVPEDFLFGFAFMVTILYAGAAAAISYSTEHANKTFTFLRGLPISPTMLAVGKIGWVLCGTLTVLIATFLTSAGFVFYQGQGAFIESLLTVPFKDSEAWIAFGFALIEVFVWGLFWSTRCRSQVPAIIGSFACPFFAAMIFTYVFFLHVNSYPNFWETMYIRFAVTGIVAPLAIWGVFRWFAFEKKSSPIARIEFRNALLFSYPVKIQSPMFALIHQHIRHASLIYSFGILCFIVFGCGSLFLCFFLPDWQPRQVHLQTLLMILVLVCFMSPFVFWGSIFGHDQRNNSYQYLSRIGVHEGAVWWSRILPPLPFYIFAGLCYGYFLFTVSPIAIDIGHATYGQWQGFILYASAFFTAWLCPIALGAFCSISLRSSLLAIVFTFIGMYPFFLWGGIGVASFGCNPLWTTLPIVLALLYLTRLGFARFQTSGILGS